MGDMVLSKNLKRKSRGSKVRLVQEWLCLHGQTIRIDGIFGAATDYATRKFQSAHSLRDDGIVGKRTFAAFIAPMNAALAPIAPGQRSLGQMVVAYARQHLKSGPREIGGKNRGPWVRLYMKGNDGDNWAWCAGFACYVLEQACRSLGNAMPITPSFSCDSMAGSAEQNGRFVKESAEAGAGLKPGAIFLRRRTPLDWTHTGIVTAFDDEVFHTIEGNTNDAGSREGDAVMAKVKTYKSRDFIRI